MPTSSVSCSAKKAFNIFDHDKSGGISATELIRILTSDTPAGKALSIKDAKEIIQDFDSRGVGELDLADFARCWAEMSNGGSVSALENHSLYNHALKSHPEIKSEISRLFKKIDVTGDGSLELDELEEIVTFYQGEQFNEEEFFSYWDVKGANDAHVGTHHVEDFASGDIDEQELAWYLADCAGMADYNDGSLDDHDDEKKAEAMRKTIHEFEQAVNYVHERQKKNEHPLHMDLSQRREYEAVLAGHRRKVSDLFSAMDADNSGSLDMDELKEHVSMLEGKAFDEAAFLTFFKGKAAGEHLSKVEFGWYIANRAKTNEAVPDLLDKVKDTIRDVSMKRFDK